MESKQLVPPLIVIVGPTASGKSALALDIAQAFNGELICADSRTIYRGMDIGTAKPSMAERARVPHRLIDVISPDQTFTAAEFKRMATIIIDDIAARQKIPILVGGTGLYIDGVIFDYTFLPPASPEERVVLENLDVATLQQKLKEQDIPLPANSSNKRHLIRTLETNGQVAVKKGLRSNTLVIGIDISKEDIKRNIEKRVDEMVSAGLEAEVKYLSESYGWDAPGMSGVGYRQWRPYFEDGETLEQVKQSIIQDTLQYAKRQRTWFKRNPAIKWIQNSAEAKELVASFMQH